MEKESILKIRNQVKLLVNMMPNPESRHLSIARTSLEDAVLRLEHEINIRNSQEMAAKFAPSQTPVVPQPDPVPAPDPTPAPTPEKARPLSQDMDLDITTEPEELDLDSLLL